MSYVPKINDYVIWNHHGIIHEGWVYFVDSAYITIETGVKPKHDNLVPMHKKHHILIVCYNKQWKELELIKTRKSNYDES